MLAPGNENIDVSQREITDAVALSTCGLWTIDHRSTPCTPLGLVIDKLNTLPTNPKVSNNTSHESRS